MSVKTIMEKGSLRAFGRGMLAWAVAATVLSFFAAVIVRALEIRSAQFGYLSSFLSFAAALLAGLGARQEGGNLLRALAGGIGLCLVLLTAGCLIGGKTQDASALLSVVSFSLAGWLLGSILFNGKKTETKYSSFKRKKKQNRKS